MTFEPCRGKSTCRDDGRQCLLCGRTLDEIAALRAMIGQLADLAIERDYTNIGTYVDYVARRLEKQIRHRRASAAAPAAADSHADGDLRSC